MKTSKTSTQTPTGHPSPPPVVFELIVTQGIWKISWNDAEFFSVNLRRARTHAGAVFPADAVGEKVCITPSVDAALSARRFAGERGDVENVARHTSRIFTEVTTLDLPLGVDDLVVLLDLDEESVRNQLWAADPASARNR